MEITRLSDILQDVIDEISSASVELHSFQKEDTK